MQGPLDLQILTVPRNEFRTRTRRAKGRTFGFALRRPAGLIVLQLGRIWTGAGTALIACVMIEVAATLFFAVKDRVARTEFATAASDAYVDRSWLEDYEKEDRLSGTVGWKPYV